MEGSEPPYLQDVGLCGNRVLDTVDCEDDVGKAVDGGAADHHLERVRIRKAFIPPVWKVHRLGLEQGGQRWTYAAVGTLAGSNVALDVGNGIGRAGQQRGTGVNDGLAARHASDGLSRHGDAEVEMQVRVPGAPRGYISQGGTR